MLSRLLMVKQLMRMQTARQIKRNLKSYIDVSQKWFCITLRIGMGIIFPMPFPFLIWNCISIAVMVRECVQKRLNSSCNYSNHTKTAWFFEVFLKNLAVWIFC